MFETMADAEAAGNEDEAVTGRREQDDLDDLFEFHEEGEEEEDDETPRVRHRAKRRPATDCPVTCSAEAIVLSIPRALTKLAIDVPSAVKLRRVWTTMCCIAVLERFVVCWLWGDGDLYPPEERCVHSRALAACFCRALISSRHAQHDRGRWARVDRGAGGGVARTGGSTGRRQADEGSAPNHQVLEPRMGATRDRAAGVARAAPPDDALACAPHGHRRDPRHDSQRACDLRGSASVPVLHTDAPARLPYRTTRSIHFLASLLTACSAGRCS